MYHILRSRGSERSLGCACTRVGTHPSVRQKLISFYTKTALKDFIEPKIKN